EFPPSPRPDEGDRLEVPLDEMLRAVEQTQMAASTDEARPVLTGVLCQIKGVELDRKSTRLNSSHLVISYAVFCLKKKNRTASRFCQSQKPRTLYQVNRAHSGLQSYALARSLSRDFSAISS